MNKYIDVKRLEFVITNKCSGKCKHCSNEITEKDEAINIETAVNVINELGKTYSIDSIMTFGGEPLLFADTVCKIHETAYENNINRRDIITNGYFTKNIETIEKTAQKLCNSKITRMLLSVDAFHQESIPIEPVIHFAKSLKKYGFNGLNSHPAWLVNKDHDNQYNKKTKEILDIFLKIGIEPSNGNNIFPKGNAVKYLHEYFKKPKKEELFVPCGSLPYTGKLDKIETIGINPNGDIFECSLFMGNVYDKNIHEIIENYNPYNNIYGKMIMEGGVEKLYNFALKQGIKINMEDCYSSCMLCKKIIENLENIVKSKTST
jgi:MoaA/NifB/PqqE/SkfB family radical SAM enzyme